MDNIFDKRVSYFKSLRDKEPKKELSLQDVLFTDRWEKPISKLRNETDQDKRKRLKSSLPFFVPSGITEGRKDSEMVKHNGVICIDIDKRDNSNVSNFDNLKNVISVVPYIAYLGLSAGGNGYFAIIPIKDPKKHKEHFKSLEIDFRRCGIKIDGSCSNECRIRFVSYDPEPYVNEEAKIYNRYVPNERNGGSQLRNEEVNAEDFATVSKWMVLLKKYGTKKEFNYGEWFSMACALAWEFGEAGRELFHSFSEAFPDYHPDDSDNKYNDALKAVNDSTIKHPTLSRIEEIFRGHGITAIADFEDINLI